MEINISRPLNLLSVNTPIKQSSFNALLPTDATHQNGGDGGFGGGGGSSSSSHGAVAAAALSRISYASPQMGGPRGILGGLPVGAIMPGSRYSGDFGIDGFTFGR